MSVQKLGIDKFGICGIMKSRLRTNRKKENKMKLTIKCDKVQVGDTVVGFKSKVKKVEFVSTGFGGKSTVVEFEDGQIWKTSDRFSTTVIR